MSDLTLYLLRHGESIANVNRLFDARKIDPPLSDAGIRQATAQALSLKNVGLSAIYSSSLLWARQTAEIISKQCELEPIFTDFLREVDLGVLDGKSQDDSQNRAILEEVIKKWEQGYNNLGFPEGETLSDVKDRFEGFLDILENKQFLSVPCPYSRTTDRCNTQADKRVLVVGHCLLFMAVIWLFCKNHGNTFEDGHMGRGHLSVISRTCFDSAWWLIITPRLSPIKNHIS